MAVLVEAIGSNMRFDRYSVVQWVDLSGYQSNLDHMAKGEMVCFHNHAESWAEHYTRNHFIDIDPVVAFGRRTSVGFRSYDIPRDRTDAERDFTVAEARAGIGETFVVPVHLPDQPSGSCSFAMNAGRELSTENLLMAQTVALFAFEAGRRFILSPGSHAIERHSLTDRQVECVMLAGRGLTEHEIGKHLGISEETVKRHLKDARTILGASKTVQAVIRLLYEQRIDLKDLL